MLSAELRKHARRLVLPAGDLAIKRHAANDELRAGSIHIVQYTKQRAIARVQQGLREGRRCATKMHV